MSSKFNKLKLKTNHEKIIIYYKIIERPKENLKSDEYEKLAFEIRKLTKDNWGDFGDDFIKLHVLQSEFVLLLNDKNKRLIGLASISIKNICQRKTYYFELTVVDKEFESLKLSFKMNYLLARKIIIQSFLKAKFSLDFMLITPNMKILGSLANFAGFIYPNPYDYDLEKKQMPLADSETWEMANELIKNTDKPDRKINREGLVLEGSYADTPWLVYEPDAIPKYRDEIVNIFGEHYLGYSKKLDKEFIVRVHFTLVNIVRGFFK